MVMRVLFWVSVIITEDSDMAEAFKCDLCGKYGERKSMKVRVEDLREGNATPGLSAYYDLCRVCAGAFSDKLIDLKSICGGGNKSDGI